MNKGLIEKAKLAAIASAIRGKNGETEQYTPDEMAAAIAAIATEGVTLPELTAPAHTGNVLFGAQYIDANGEKQVGTMPDVADKIVFNKMPDGKLTMEMFNDASGYVDCDDPFPAVSATSLEANLIAENVRAGVSIFGVSGTCKKITMHSGTWTTPDSTNTAELPCPEGARCIIIDAPASMYEANPRAANAIFTVCGCMLRSVSNSSFSTFWCAATTTNVSGAFVTTMGKAIVSDGISLGTSTTTYKFAVNELYRWTAFYWDD